jgi:hypothetical protein
MSLGATRRWARCHIVASFNHPLDRSLVEDGASWFDSGEEVARFLLEPSDRAPVAARTTLERFVSPLTRHPGPDAWHSASAGVRAVSDALRLFVADDAETPAEPKHSSLVAELNCLRDALVVADAQQIRFRLVVQLGSPGAVWRWENLREAEGTFWIPPAAG